jgi:predicted transcriptional regulator
MNDTKRLKGKQVTITLSPYIFGQLSMLSEKKHLSKSAIMTIAIEDYARKFEKEEVELSADKK